MNKVILFLTLLVALFYANANASEDLVKLCTENDVAPTIHEKLYAIGFSTTQPLYAYIGQGYHEGMGSYYWKLNIRNLDNKLVNHFDHTTGSMPQSHPPQALLQRMKSEAIKYDIKMNEVSGISNFPISTDDALIDAYLLAGEEVKDNGINTRSMNIYLTDSLFDFKRIGEVKEVVFFNHMKKFGYKIKGFLRDPVSDNIAVVVVFYTREDEESDVICKYKLFAANTTIEPYKNNRKSPFLKTLIKQAPYRIETYIRQGDNYWMSKDFVNAKRSYQAYIELMRYSGKENSIPAYALERAQMENMTPIKN